ncbi:Ig-like domain-containing protein, partial [Mycobacterium sp. NPDC006124]|uniref:Ig-like domain-containing protein n=1 Tax=Mycobacterium sp. NPDC006124 TaxID=3156729 RepID=UPI0033BE5124
MSLAAATPPTTPTPVLQEGPIAAILAIPAVAVRIISTVAATLLAPFLGTTPPIPAQTPILWAVLAWVQRELERTFDNHAPTADVDVVTTGEDTPVTIDVTRGGHVDPDAGDVVTVSSFTQPAHGTVALVGGKLVYTPVADYNGPDSFSYTVSDATSPFHVHGLGGLIFGGGHSDTSMIAVTVTAVNDVPIARNDTLAALQGSGPTSVDVLRNDTDVDTGQTLTVTGTSTAAHGTVVFTGTNVVYTPTANYAGTDSFTYTVGDGQGGTAVGTVAVTVVLVNREVAFDGPAIGPLVVTPDGSRALQLVSLPDAFAFGGTKVYVIDTTTG